MRVRFTTTVDIDAVAWELTYGITDAGLHADVKEYLDNLVREALHQNDLLRRDAP